MSILKSDERESIRRSLIEDINNHCIYRVSPDEDKLPAKEKGKFYTWQFYMRKRLFDVDFMRRLSFIFIDDLIDDYTRQPFQIAGMETGSTPLLSALPIFSHTLGMKINSFSIRKEQKEYGLRNWIEGEPNDLPIVVVDDLANSGFSLMRSYQILTHLNLPIHDFTWSVVRKSGGVRARDLPVGEIWENRSAFELSDFDLDYADFTR